MPDLVPAPSRRADLGFAALFVASAAWLVPYLGVYVHDDTFISMRYARNLLEGHGLVFDRGERVEGYTNLLWTLLLAACGRLHVRMEIAAPVLASLALLGLLALVYRFAIRYGNLPHRAWALVPVLLLAAHPMLHAESLGGLETTFFMLLVFAGFARFVAESRGEARGGGSAALLGAATLVRPEAGLVFAILQATRFLRERDARTLGRDAGVYALLVAPHIAFRLAYYGDWLPNTFYAKVGSSWEQVRRGAVYFWEYGAEIISPPVLALAVAGGLLGGWRSAALAVAAAYSLYIVAVGGDYEPTGRFALIPLPFVALLIGSTLVAAHRALQPRRTWSLVVPVGVALLAAGWSAEAARHRLELRSWPAVVRDKLVARRYLGTFLRDTLPPGAVVAVGSIGAIGYYSGLPILDTFGLTNREIGRRRVEWMGRASAGHEKGDAEYVLRRAPQVIVFDLAFLAPRMLSQQEFLDRARSPTEHLLLEQPSFFEKYGLRAVPSPAGVVHYLERIESP